MRATMLKTNSNRKEEPNCDPADMKKAFRNDVLFESNMIMVMNEMTALVQVTGKIGFRSV